jgi:ribosomal peptide maturation radical SAM protein 1
MSVLLINMPWGAIERPALGLSLLKAALARKGIGCQVEYLNMTFGDFLGLERYQWVNHQLPYTAFAGDWLFTESLYGADGERDAAYIQDVLRGEWQLSEASIAELCALRSCVEPFLSHVMARIPWQRYGLVGFTSTFEQNIASLSLARRIKQAAPHLPIVFGGANWEDEMGLEYHRVFAFVDYVCSGEADESFPELAGALIEAAAGPREQRIRSIPGVVYRTRGESRLTKKSTPIQDMDGLPLPDYGDYAGSLKRSHAGQNAFPVLLFEGSRGCWWGAKSHCTFCGLNGESMGFRSKSSKRLLEEIETLAAKWPFPTLEAVDNILDMKYFAELLPALESLELPGEIFFEVKANLRRRHVAALKRAHISRIQPGIESLSDHVLSLMRKGTSGLQNVQLLKWCKEYGVQVDWNLLYGFPGERDEDYEAIMVLMPKIRHLELASSCGPIRLDRFSPYFERPADFGLTNLRPLPVYRYLYPVRGIELHRIAYYFLFEYAAEWKPSALANTVIDYIAAHRSAPEQGTLRAQVLSNGGMIIHDTRGGARAPQTVLSAAQRVIYQAIDEACSIHRVMEALSRALPNETYDAGDVTEFLQSLVDNDLAACGNGRFLGLALMPQEIRPLLERAAEHEHAQVTARRVIPIVQEAA